LRKVTSNAVIPIPKGSILSAWTFFSRRVIFLIVWTIFAIVRFCYIKLIIKAWNTFLSIKLWVCLRANRALISGKIVDLSIRALRAEFSGIIKVIRDVTRNTGIIIPEEVITASTFLFRYIIGHSLWTTLASLWFFIEILRTSTSGAFESIKVRISSWTISTSL
jgi:hypothetical protein